MPPRVREKILRIPVLHVYTDTTSGFQQPSRSNQGHFRVGNVQIGILAARSATQRTNCVTKLPSVCESAKAVGKLTDLTANSDGRHSNLRHGVRLSEVDNRSEAKRHPGHQLLILGLERRIGPRAKHLHMEAALCQCDRLLNHPWVVTQVIAADEANRLLGSILAQSSPATIASTYRDSGARAAVSISKVLSLPCLNWTRETELKPHRRRRR